MEKYEELYRLSIDVLKEEQNRFNRIDEKASKYFTIFTLLIGVYGFFGKWMIDNIINPKCCLEYFLIILYILCLISIFSAWIEVFNVLRIQIIEKIPLNDEMIEFFSEHRLIDIYYALAIGNKEAVERNLKVTDYKSRKLEYGYRLIRLNIILLMIFLLISGIYSYLIHN